MTATLAAILAASLAFLLGLAIGIRRPCPELGGGDEAWQQHKPWTRDDDEPIAPADPWTYRPTSITTWPR